LYSFLNIITQIKKNEVGACSTHGRGHHFDKKILMEEATVDT
jgi:hypothetical protein